MSIFNAIVSAALAGAVNQRSAKKAEGRWRDRWEFMEGKGLTPQEISGSGVSGAGATSGQNLGNMESLARNQLAKAQEKKVGKELQTQLDIAKIGADAQRDVANIQTGQQQRQLEVQKGKIAQEIAIAWDKQDISRKQLNLAVDQWNTDKKPRTAAFILYKTALTMGTENLIVSGMYNFFKQHGIDLLSPDGKIEPEPFVKAIELLQSQRASTRPEFEFLKEEITDGLIRVQEAGRTIGNKIRDKRDDYQDKARKAYEIDNPGVTVIGNKPNVPKGR